MIIVDAHLDFGPFAVVWNRDITLPVADIRRIETGISDKAWRAQGTVALPEVRLGRIAVAVAVIWSRTGPPPGSYASPGIAHAIAKGQLAYYRHLSEEGHCRLLLNRQDLEDHVREWQAWDQQRGNDPIKDASETPRPGFILSMECADAILHPEQVEAWWKDGLRLIGPAHGGENVYVHGEATKNDGGLKPGAQSLLAHMQKFGMGLDTAHLSDRSFWEALEIWEGPIIASHANCRALVPGQRQLDDRQICAITERGGMIGTMLWSRRLLKGWTKGKSPAVTLDTVVDHIDHICQLVGNAQHIGIGSDLDGGYGYEEVPREMDTIADLQKIPETLEKRGYKPAEITGIMHGNWLRFFANHLPD